jgi:hypothetical protein
MQTVEVYMLVFQVVVDLLVTLDWLLDRFLQYKLLELLQESVLGPDLYQFLFVDPLLMVNHLLVGSSCWVITSNHCS